VAPRLNPAKHATAAAEDPKNLPNLVGFVLDVVRNAGGIRD